MPEAAFHFIPDLTFFLPPQAAQGSLRLSFAPDQSIKHLIEALGVPHTEVGAIQVNGQAAGFDHLARDGDRVTIYPASAQNSPLTGEARFVLDNHLGRMAAYLRMAGFDTLYRNNFDDEELAQIAQDEERILVTRDRRLLMRKAVRRGYCPRSLESRQQTVEILRRFGLAGQIAPFRRCLRCNTPLQRVSKEAVLDRLLPLTRLYYDEFHICPACGQIYWKGSHYEHMQSLIAQLRDSHPTPTED